MSADDLIYAPIVPEDKLKKLLKKIIQNPDDRGILDAVADQIVELFGAQGITDEKEIVETVYRRMQEIEVAPVILPDHTGHTAPHTRAQAVTAGNPHRPAWF